MDHAGIEARIEREDRSQVEASGLMFNDQSDALVAHNDRQDLRGNELFQLKELDVQYDCDLRTLWTHMRPSGRPSFTPSLLDDFDSWQRLIPQQFGPEKTPLDFLVLGSREPGVFCFGGDLKLFEQLIRERDHSGLVEYGHRCCRILHRNIGTLGLPMVTIGLAQGSALGGGFEALLSFDVVIAERDATFGLPEIMFGLFPGMGAHALLSRKLGSALAERLILSNDSLSAEYLHEIGIVHHLAEPGEGEAACRAYIKSCERRHGGIVHANRAMKVAWNLKLEELNEITELWADAAMQLTQRDLRIMCRLAGAQERLAQSR